ncbi:HI0074 family nucleotidyltransferase substrate-binding subunit [Duganella sp. Dugasp56]|uniref:HI0074 family nucleotidyltransferase substrate-binding subunit n=1 Tax=Duganella sp. Dugasp56 TaxID=3243046 RepID=UPI0039AFE041
MSKCLAERVNDFLTAMTRLEEALAQPEDSFMRDATIQRFEFTYELAWRSLKLWLETKDISALNAKDTLQAALEQGLLVDGNGLNQLHRMRNLASHAYDETQARQVYRFIKNDGFQLLRVLADQILRQRTSGIGASA